MWRNTAVGLSKLYIRNTTNWKINLCRTFLSESYKCTEAWSSRHSSQILQKVRLDELYYELDQRFQQGGGASAIDVDIFANTVRDDNYIDELSDLLHKLRLTPETENTLESTSHAVIRILFDLGLTEQLLNILNDRLNYGVFLDFFSANIMLDSFIKSKDFTFAARVASMLMLQEDFSHPITTHLSLYSCYKYLENPQPFEPIDDTPVEPQSKKKPEEIKIRVKFLRNEFYDDHFDIRDSNMLVGKTLNMIGSTMNNILGSSSKLVGLILYQKYDKALQFLENLDKNVVYVEALTLGKQAVEKASETDTTDNKETCDKLMLLMNKFDGIEGLDHDLKACVADAVHKQEPIDMIEQCKTYQKWNELRETKLKEQLLRLQHAQRVAEAETKRKQLEEEERKLWFFEQEEQLDLEIEDKRVFYHKRWFGKKKKPRVIDEGYIPPEIVPQKPHKYT